MILWFLCFLCVGKTFPAAFFSLYRLERACQVQVDAASAGTVNTLGDNIATKSGDDIDGPEGVSKDTDGLGQLEFAALMRKIDKVDSSYRN